MKNYYFYIFISFFLFGCSTVQEDANARCMSVKNKEKCISNYVTIVDCKNIARNATEKKEFFVGTISCVSESSFSPGNFTGHVDQDGNFTTLSSSESKGTSKTTCGKDIYTCHDFSNYEKNLNACLKKNSVEMMDDVKKDTNENFFDFSFGISNAEKCRFTQSRKIIIPEKSKNIKIKRGS